MGIQVGSDAEMIPRTYIDNVQYAYGLRQGAGSEIRMALQKKLPSYVLPSSILLNLPAYPCWSSAPLPNASWRHPH